MKDSDSPVKKHAVGHPEARRSDDTLAARRRGGAVTPGRLGVFTALGAATGFIPFPWVPDALSRRVRGALAQDVASRHGLSLTREARAIFAEPAGPEGPRGVFGQALRYFTGKVLVRFGPLGMFPPVRAGLHMFVLGHLFGRYLETARDDRSVRIDVEEARNVRRAIDRALVHAMTAELDTESEKLDAPVEDLRDDVTQAVDGVLITAAGVPGWLVRRLDAAFDDVLPHAFHG